MKRLTDPSFRYTNSVNTDLRRTFARVRAQLRAEAEASAKKVQPIQQRRKA